MAKLDNREWSKLMGGIVVFFHITQLPHAMRFSLGAGKPYALGWWRPSDNTTHVEYSDVAPTLGEVEATYVP